MKKTADQYIVFFLLIIFLLAQQAASRVAVAEDVPLLRELCSPVYEGRGVGTEGNRLAAQLLTEELKNCALTPLEGYSSFLIPFKQDVAVVKETKMAAVMEDGSREELVYGKDYLFVGTSSTINGTFPVVRQAEKADASAILFLDQTNAERTPQSNAFATIVSPVEEFHFNSAGISDEEALSNSDASLPRISMLLPVYNRIKEAASLEIRYNFEKTVTTLNNVVGVLPGKDRTRAVIVSAHFDGAGDQAGNRLPCALDNASGVSAVDLVLNQMAGTEPPYDVVFAFTNAEEAGLAGAYDLSWKLMAQYQALYNINVDCVGLKGIPFPMQSPDESAAALYRKMEAYLSRYGFSCVPEIYGSSDNDAFVGAGIPSVVLGTPDLDIIHTANDTVEHIEPEVIRGIAGMIVDFITENPDIHAEVIAPPEEEAASMDVPTLAYNEAVLQDDTLYAGSYRWMTYSEALRYYPTLPLPQVYQGCSIEECMVMLSTFNLPDCTPGQIITLPDGPQNAQTIMALYSDGTTGYKIEFNAAEVKDSYTRQMVGENGFLLTTRENNADVVQGVGLQRGELTLYLMNGDVSGLMDAGDGISVHALMYGTSKVTVENASDYLADPELTALFEALCQFVQP